MDSESGEQVASFRRVIYARLTEWDKVDSTDVMRDEMSDWWWFSEKT